MKHQMKLRVGPAVFRIGSAWERPVRQLRMLYKDYPVDQDAIADCTVRLEPAGPFRRWWRPSVRIVGDYMLPDAAPVALRHGLLAAEMGMNLQIALGWRRHLLIHASSVEKGGRVVVMSGESGSGKSTLAAVMGERGWRFMGDEFALIGLDDGLIHPFPRLVSLKNEAIPVMRDVVGDNGRFGAMLTGTPKGDIIHLVPPEGAIGRMNEAGRPALLLFPRFGFPREISTVGRAEAFMRLTQASTNYVALGEAGFEALHQFVTGVPALALDFPSADAAIDAIEGMWSSVA